MRVISLITLLVLLSIFQVDAQEPTYQLRELSVHEYIAEIGMLTDSFSDIQPHIAHAISQEFDILYGDVALSTLSLNELNTFQQAIGTSLSNRDDCIVAILERTLEYETIITLTDLSIDGFDITVTSIDFDGDGQPEVLLDIYDQSTWGSFYTVLNDDNEIYWLPVPTFGLRGSIGSIVSKEVNVVDLDENNDDELIVEVNHYGYWINCWFYYVIDLQSDTFINVGGNLLDACTTHASSSFAFSFAYTAPLLSHGVLTIEHYRDGWNCEISDTDIVDLERGIARTISIYADTVWCDMRFASIAFDNEDYTTAIELYSQILPQIDGELAQYIASRLVLSYMLSDATGEALLLFESIEPHGQMGDLLIALREGYPDATMMCQIAFDFFWDINSSTRIDDTDRFANPYEWTPPYFYFGGPTPNDPRYYPQPSPHIAGCNINEISPANIIEHDSTAITFNNARSFASYHIDDLLINGEYHEVLRRIDEFLTSDIFDYENGNCKPCYSQQLRYWRGLTLSLMGDETGALTEYISLAEDYPMSYWGQLASIHFEVIP